MPSISSPSILQIKNAVGSVVVAVTRSIKFTGGMVVTEATPGEATVDGTSTTGSPWDVAGNGGAGLKLGLTTNDPFNLYQNNLVRATFGGSGVLTLFQTTVAGKAILDINADPTAGGGFVAPIGSLAMWDNGGIGTQYTKTGAANTAWTPNTGSGSPSGAAGGSLAGSYPNPSLSLTGAAAGTYGDATNVAQITVTTEGRISSVTSVPISGGGGANTALSNLASVQINTDLIFAVVAPGTTAKTVKTDDTAAAQQSNPLTIRTGNSSSSGQQSGAVIVASGSSVNANSGSITVITGSATSAGHSGNLSLATGPSDASTGDLSIATGVSANTASGLITITTGTCASGFNTGAVSVRSGVRGASGSSGIVTLASGTTASSPSGNVFVGSGTSSGSTTGFVSVSSGAASGTSGGVTVFSGTSSAGNTGAVTIQSGDSATQISGNLTIASGTSVGLSGVIAIATGNSSAGPSGTISLTTGTAGTTRGSINLSALYLRLPLGTVDPGGVVGAVYYNTGSNTIRWFNGTVWADL